MEFRILGPFEVRRGGEQLGFAPRERALLAVLLLHANEVVPRDELIDRLWGGRPPTTAKESLQNVVSAVRKKLADGFVETATNGYRLNVDPDSVDALRFESLVRNARTAEPGLRAERLREALAYWRGPALSDYPFAETEIARLEELRLVAIEERFDAELELGEHAALVPDLEALVLAHPLRERLWAQLMLALYRSGRPAEALATYRRAHAAFVDELGIEPGATLRELQRAILVQDPALFELHRGPDLIERAAVFLPGDDRKRAEVLYDYGHALWRTGERARARSALLECERRAVATGTRALVSRARVLRAHHAVQAAEIGLAEFERITREELEAVRAEEEPVAVADVLQARGLALRDLGRADDAAACHEEGLRISLEIGDRWREGFARNLFGFAEMLGTTPVATAVAHCERHLKALEWGPPGPVGLWMALAVLETQAGRRDEGRERLETAARELRAVGAASTLSTVEFFAAWTAAMAGEAARARNHARTAVELLDSLADLGSRASYTLLLARLEAEAGQLDEAERLVASAHATPHQDDVFARVWSARALAAIATAKGDDPRAQELLREAVEATRTTDWLTVTAETLEQAGALEEALGAFEEKGDDLGAARVRQRLRQASE